MRLTTQLQQELLNLAGYRGPGTHLSQFSDPSGLELEIDFLMVDTVGCSVEELRLFVSSLAHADMQTLEDWAKGLCARISYLLENIGPLERDDQNQQMLIRSTPPGQSGVGAKYYEIILGSLNGGRFSLKRYEARKGVPGRSGVPMQLTHEVLLRLVEDLVDTIP